MNEAAFRQLISGESKGLAARAMRGGLGILSQGYRLAVAVRNASYDRGWLRVPPAPAAVVSVGNLTTGGTGKTPVVCWLAQWFHGHQVRAAILSRGYRPIAGAENDEKRLLDMLCPRVPHLQNPDRVASARAACDEHDSRVLILDDGFQHRRMARQLDIVLIDALNPWGYGHVLPRGLLREPPGALQRADFVLLTRADQASDRKRSEILDSLRQLAPRADLAEAAFPPRRLVNCRGEAMELETLRDRRLAAFCGIGNPDGFRRMLGDAGLASVGFREFADHHHYSASDVADLESWLKSIGADVVVTTQKDLVKFNRTDLAGRPLWAVEIGLELLAGMELLEERLQAVAGMVPMP